MKYTGTTFEEAEAYLRKRQIHRPNKENYYDPKGGWYNVRSYNSYEAAMKSYNIALKNYKTELKRRKKEKKGK